MPVQIDCLPQFQPGELTFRPIPTFQRKPSLA